MRRWSYIAACSLIVFALPAWAQRGGGHGGGSGHFAGGGAHFASGGFAGHSAGGFRGGGFNRGSGITVRVGPGYGRRGFYGRRGIYPYYYPYLGYYPYGYWDWYNLDNGSDDQSSVSDVNSYYPPPYAGGGQLQSDLQTLNGKIDQLQQDIEARNQPKPQAEPTTALVFRDKHVEEVRNYAIAGGTLWVLNDQAAKRIPLDELDLAATAKVNEDRGVDFQIPR
ncbi:MAG: hypothetical protein WBW53_07000 [Terriglobales bacterium]